MAGRVERDLDAVARQDLAIGGRLDGDVAEALPEDLRGRRMADIDLGAEAGMIGVGVGDDRAGNAAPRIDMKVARGAIEAAIGRRDEVHGKWRLEAAGPPDP